MERRKASRINSYNKNLIKLTLIFFYIVFISCFNLKFQEKNIISNQWQGQKISLAKLGKNYKRQYRFNRMLSKFTSSKFLPYYKFIGKNFKIIGSYEANKRKYLIIKDKKQRLFKIHLKKNALPSFIVFEETLENAKNLIGKSIWLNDVFDQLNFLTDFPISFRPFQNVYVNDVVSFQNSDEGYPIWLKVSAKNGEEAIVRYNIQGRRVGIKDHYFKIDPLPKGWGNELSKKIKDRRADIGMTSRQVQIAIGYPDKIINTSSLHGVSEQWVYSLKNKKIYYQFEYDTLIYINN